MVAVIGVVIVVLVVGGGSCGCCGCRYRCPSCVGVLRFTLIVEVGGSLPFLVAPCPLLSVNWLLLASC